MRRIFAAIGAALRAAFSAFRFAVSIPGRALAWLLGGTAAPAPIGDSPIVQDLKGDLAETRAAEAIEASARAAAQLARAIMMWCCDALEADGPVPVPPYPNVSRRVAEWLPGLTRDECQVLICAEKQAILAHIEGRQPISGVRPVQRLDARPDGWGQVPAVAQAPDLDDANAEHSCGPSCA